MQPTKEAWEKWDKFLPWLNENPYRDRTIPWDKRGLKDGAPEEAKAAYVEFLDMVKRRQERGVH